MTGSPDTISSCYNYYTSFLNGFESPEFNNFLDDESIPFLEKVDFDIASNVPGFRIPCPKFDYFETEILDKEEELIEAVNSIKFSFNNDPDIKFQINQVYDSVIDITTNLKNKILSVVYDFDNKPIHFLNDIINQTLLDSLEKITDHIIFHHKKYLYPGYKKKRSILYDHTGREIFHRVQNLVNIDPLTRYHILAHKNYNETIHHIPFLVNDITIDTVKLLFRGNWAPTNFTDFDEEAISIENFFERDTFDFDSHPKLTSDQLLEFEDLIIQDDLASKKELNFDCYTINKRSGFPDFRKSAELLNTKFPLCTNYINGQDYNCHLLKQEDDNYLISFTPINNMFFGDVFSSKSFFFNSLYRIIRKEIRHPIEKYCVSDFELFPDYINFVLLKLDKYKKDTHKIINTLHIEYEKLQKTSFSATGKYFAYHTGKSIPYLTNISIYENLITTIDNIITDINTRYSSSIKYYSLPGILPESKNIASETPPVYKKLSKSKSKSEVRQFSSFELKNFNTYKDTLILAYEKLIEYRYLIADKAILNDQRAFMDSFKGTKSSKPSIWDAGATSLHYFIDQLLDTTDLFVSGLNRWLITCDCFHSPDGPFDPHKIGTISHLPGKRHQKRLTEIINLLKTV